MITFGRVVLVGAVLAGLAAAMFYVVENMARAGMKDGLAFNAQGDIRVPAVDYRKDWFAIGSWAVVADETGSKGLHIVYTQPETVASFRRTGKFPDGAILIKELHTAKTETMTTGVISRADEKAGWFVMIKDTKNRFPDNKLWGDGWAWAFFAADSPNKTKTIDYKDECIGCHIPAKATDWIYVQGYPGLEKPQP